MWVAVAPAARAPPHEIDNRSSWLEKGLIQIKTFFFFLPTSLIRGFPVTVDLTPHSQRALGLLFFLPACASLLPPPSSPLRPAQPELKTVLLRHMTLGPDPGLLFQAVYPDLGNLGESP